MQEEETLSKDEVVDWYKDQIELATLRRDLAVLQSEATKAEAERLQAAMMIGQIKMAEEQMTEEGPTAPVVEEQN